MRVENGVSKDPRKGQGRGSWGEIGGDLRCLGALAYLPALHFVLPGGEEVDELDLPEACGDDLRQGAHCLMLQQNLEGLSAHA